MAQEVESVEAVLDKYIPEPELAKVKQVLYGQAVEPLVINKEALKCASDGKFEIKGYSIPASAEQLRNKRIVRVAAIQNKIVKATSEPIVKQRAALHARVGEMIEASAKAGANIVCLQETWHMPFAFCTREKQPWAEFAEPAETGPTTTFLCELARRYNIVIVNPILERDEVSGNLWNTAVIINNDGRVLGKTRKNHIPRVNDFNESTYYLEGNMGHPVFETAFGRLGVVICYGRHHPLEWMANGWNTAEIVFNPSATVGALSEPLWAVEARCAAIANGYFTVAINRIGTESFKNEFTSGDGKPAHNDFGHFYGSSYIAAPDGRRTPGLSRTCDGVLITEMDLNLCRQTADKWMFRCTSRLPMYAELLTQAARPDYRPQLVRQDDKKQARGPEHSTDPSLALGPPSS